MSAQRQPEVDSTIYAVRQWKETLDPSAKWWQRWFYKLAYKPFNELALRVFKIPPATSVTCQGDKITFQWIEDAGYFGSEHEADLACLTPRDSYQSMTYGRAFPTDSAQCVGPTIFPRAKDPRRRAKPILQMIIKDRKQEEKEHQQLAQCLSKLNQVLDR